MADASKPAVSVVVPTRERRASVERLLEALARQTLAPDAYEVIVVVDGSNDGTWELLQSLRPPYALHAIRQENRGRAAARNAGVRAARGRLLVLLDDDMEPLPALLAAHLRAHDGGAPCCVLGAAPITSNGRSPLERYLARKFDEHLARIAAPDHRFVARDFYSGNFSVDRESFSRLGLFDERFGVLYGNEDVELALRAQKTGFRIRFEPRAVALQRVETDVTRAIDNAGSKGRSAVLVAAKHPYAASQLRLATYGSRPRAWRVLRAILLFLSRRTRIAPSAVAGITRMLEARNFQRMHLVYDFVFDYFYWLGVEAALAEQDGRGRWRADPRHLLLP